MQSDIYFNTKIKNEHFEKVIEVYNTNKNNISDTKLLNFTGCGLAILDKLENNALNIQDLDNTTLFTLHLRMVEQNCSLICK